jgi:hypothetical protein
VPVNGNVTLTYNPGATQDYSVAWDNYIWNSWNIPQSYKTYKFGNPGTGTPVIYYMNNGGSTPMTLVIKIFKVNIKSI